MKASTQQVLIKLTNYMVHSSIVNTELKELPELIVAFYRSIILLQV